MNTELKNAVKAADLKAQYDARVKRLILPSVMNRSEKLNAMLVRVAGVVRVCLRQTR